MTEKYGEKLALAFIIILAIIGIIGYSLQSSESPIRVLFKTKGGAVIFDHRAHLSENEYGIKCIECHHDIDDETKANEKNCRSCHGPGKECDAICEDAPVHKQCIGNNCIECHNKQGMDAGECSLCHRQ
ncbi:MAG: cytochrome c3 family protein [Spirochaetota bacterium]|nr:cytochrome c3 family protein [Spirochaetota bacterium]